MKLWHSFIKELKLSSKSFYFFMEIFMALVLLFLLVFVIPENFDSKSNEYIYLDLPQVAEEAFIEALEDIDGKAEKVEIKNGKEIVKATYYENDEKKFYIIDNKEDMISLVDNKSLFGASVEMNDQGEPIYEYYLQGYETQRLKNLMLIFHNEDMKEVEKIFNAQDVRALSENVEMLTDRENIIPSFFTFNGSIMGLFIIAAYIFLDKKEGVIKAYAVTASSVWQYLMSKVLVITVTSVVTTFIIALPVLGFKINYLLLFVFLVTTGFFASSLGLLIASFYKDIMQAFGAIYVFMMAFILPNVAYFIPSWEPTWIKIIPTHPMLMGFKEIILKDGDTTYVLMTSLGFLLAGAVLFIISNIRYKKTLTV